MNPLPHFSSASSYPPAFAADDKPSSTSPLSFSRGQLEKLDRLSAPPPPLFRSPEINFAAKFQRMNEIARGVPARFLFDTGEGMVYLHLLNKLTGSIAILKDADPEIHAAEENPKILAWSDQQDHDVFQKVQDACRELKYSFVWLNPKPKEIISPKCFINMK